MARLQKHSAYTYTTEGGKKIKHFKHLVVIPEDAVDKAGFKEGAELEVEASKGEIVLKVRSK
jgi:hypothetical protein